MSKVDAIYRLYIRGYYTAEQALALGKRKLSDEDYAILEAMIAEEEARRNPPDPEPQPDEEPQEDTEKDTSDTEKDTEPTDEQHEEETPQTED